MSHPSPWWNLLWIAQAIAIALAAFGAWYDAENAEVDMTSGEGEP